MIADDSEISELCAYNIHIGQYQVGRVIAEGLVDKIGGKGNVVMVTGMPGNSVDDQRDADAKDVFAKHPDINIVAEVVGMWSEVVGRAELTKISKGRS